MDKATRIVEHAIAKANAKAKTSLALDAVNDVRAQLDVEGISPESEEGQRRLGDAAFGDMSSTEIREMARAIRLVNLFKELSEIAYGVEEVTDIITCSKTLQLYGKIVRGELLEPEEAAYWDKYFTDVLSVDDAISLFASYDGIDAEVLRSEYEYVNRSKVEKGESRLIFDRLSID